MKMNAVTVSVKLESSLHARAVGAALNMLGSPFKYVLNCEWLLNHEGFEKSGIMFDVKPDNIEGNCRANVICIFGVEIIQNSTPLIIKGDPKRKRFIKGVRFQCEMPIGLLKDPHRLSATTVEEEMDWAERALKDIIEIIGSGLFSGARYEISHPGHQSGEVTSMRTGRCEKRPLSTLEKIILKLVQDEHWGDEPNPGLRAAKLLSSMEDHERDERIRLSLGDKVSILTVREFLSCVAIRNLFDSTRTLLSQSIAELKIIQKANKLLRSSWNESTELPSNDLVCKQIAEYTVNSQDKELWRIFGKLQSVAKAIEDGKFYLFTEYDIASIYNAIGDRWMDICPKYKIAMLKSVLDCERIIETSVSPITKNKKRALL